MVKNNMSVNTKTRDFDFEIGIDDEQGQLFLSPSALSELIGGRVYQRDIERMMPSSKY